MSNSSESSYSRSSEGPAKPQIEWRFLTRTQKAIQRIIKSLATHRVNTLTELCRIERIAASCDDEVDARAFQEPMTAAWVYYVTSNQFLAELRGFTRSYPFCGDIVSDAHARVRADPDSNRSWNLAWLCLVKMRDDGLIAAYAAAEASKPEMWGDSEPAPEHVAQLAACFEQEWTAAIEAMMRHWKTAPTWY
ncbi:hypothetical protein ACRE_035830 [Hapsidospora chrysogenum ATCC 11550]|uniref:Uncharacterized protein n=1 Tax=Hapsidospora chrysogenum (strain ATCC 11550 / CBS 779.69 / DSM 880 / IAM 14645 / JCM 23072 / IMI 49137) TaxID=857340 RepID=A0A086T8B4_HAPC1|nr:hypothetical protein ACRE_035830 [Hapsidospora chrysogenum ATCC 11550]